MVLPQLGAKYCRRSAVRASPRPPFWLARETIERSDSRLVQEDMASQSRKQAVRAHGQVR
jgi:hypothetical protein